MVDYHIHNCTIARLIDDLTYTLGSTMSFHIDENTGTIHIFHKYYDQAEWVLPRLNTWERPPEFVVYESDLTLKLRAELIDLRSTFESLNRVMTDAITRILESVSCRYYHISGVAARVRWRFEK